MKTKKFSKPNTEKFRFVLLDDNRDFKKVLYESETFNGYKSQEFGKEYLHQILVFADKYNFADYDNAPDIEVQVKYDNRDWEYYSNAIEEYFNY